jgi:hypothetical protein
MHEKMNQNENKEFEMEKEIAVRSDIQLMIDDINQSETLCQSLLKCPHYAKMGKEGVYAIIQKAASLKVHPMEALNGGMYFVQGKVELSAILMAKLIRQQKHSITLDRSSDETICILHGKRADNGDTWKTSFSVADAKRAGIYQEKGPWGKYPDVMCYNRALSKLARQLFPDVIGNCYVEGEISIDLPEPKKPSGPQTQDEQSIEQAEIVTALDEDQIRQLEYMLAESSEEFRTTVLNFLQQRFGAPDFRVLPADMYIMIHEKISKHLEQNKISSVA